MGPSIWRRANSFSSRLDRQSAELQKKKGSLSLRARVGINAACATAMCVEESSQSVSKMSLEALNREIFFFAQEQFLINTFLLQNICIGKCCKMSIFFATLRTIKLP